MWSGSLRRTAACAAPNQFKLGSRQTGGMAETNSQRSPFHIILFIIRRGNHILEVVVNPSLKIKNIGRLEASCRSAKSLALGTFHHHDTTTTTTGTHHCTIAIISPAHHQSSNDPHVICSFLPLCNWLAQDFPLQPPRDLFLEETRDINS